MLAQGISSGERMDYTLQKAVELGVTAIQPIAAKRSVVKLAGERADRRVAHWQGVVASACEQCGRNQVPVVAPPLPLAHWLGQQKGGRLLFLSPWPRRDWPTCLPPLQRSAWWRVPKVASRPMRSLRCMLQAPYPSAWGHAYCAPRPPRWRRWRRCRHCGGFLRAGQA